MAPAENDVDRLFQIVFTLLVGGLVAFAVVDLVLDRPAFPSVHVFVEATFFAVGVAILMLVRLAWKRMQAKLTETREALADSRAPRDSVEQRINELPNNLNRQVEEQFERWCLTPAECRVVLLLLQGYEYRECAEILGRSERTVRQHGVNVYRKSGLSGRAKLSGFFLGDVLLPLRRTHDTGGGEPPEA